MRIIQVALIVAVLIYQLLETEAYEGGRVDGITNLQTLIKVDNNQVFVQAAKSPNGKTAIVLATPKDNWTKEFKITASGVLGYSLKCGDQNGSPMKGLNQDIKYAKVELPNGSSPIGIQFLKAKTFGVMTDYGTMTLPPSVRGYTIVFFWPLDAPGDHWNHFLNILDEGQKATAGIAGISGNVIKVAQDAASLIAMVP